MFNLKAKPKKARLVIAGTRTFGVREDPKTKKKIISKEDYLLFRKEVKNFISSLDSNNIQISQIVTGGCYGTDCLGKLYAIENKIPWITFPAQWSQYGKSAGPIRNKEMAEYGDILLAFWDYDSPGTCDMINEMQSRAKVTKIVRIQHTSNYIDWEIM